MATHARLLPPHSATPFELAMSQVNDPWATLGDEANSIPVLDNNPPTALLPFLIWQYGLGELSPYLPNLNDLIAQGIQWQRIRGTPASIAMALGWLGYAADLEEEPPRHVRWNRFQLGLGTLPFAENPDLGRIEGVVSLSPPIRSNFGRGYFGFDVRAGETSYQKFSDAIYSDHSGVRLPGGTVQWSFGRETVIAYEFTQDDLTALGCWETPAEALGAWNTLTTAWTAETTPWWSGYAQSRRNTIVAAITTGRSLVAFRDASNAVIGYAPAIVRGVSSSTTGEYQIGRSAYAISDTPLQALALCRSPFNASPGSIVASVGLAFQATLASGVKPGKQWFSPSDVSSAVTVGWSAASFIMAETIREHVAFVLDLDTH